MKLKNNEMRRLFMWLIASSTGMIISHTNIVLDIIIVLVGISLFIKIDGGIS